MIPDAENKWGRDHTGKPFTSWGDVRRYHNRPGVVGGERRRTARETIRARNLERDQEELRAANQRSKTHCVIHGVRHRLKVYPSGERTYRHCHRCAAAKLNAKLHMTKQTDRGVTWSSPLNQHNPPANRGGRRLPHAPH